MVIKADSNFTEAHYSLGLIYLRLNRVSDAHESLERAHAMNPSHSETIKTLARIYYTQKNYPKTVEVLNLLPEGILLLRDNSEILAALGNSYWYLGQHKKTERMYERVLQHDSEHMTAMKSLGMQNQGFVDTSYLGCKDNCRHGSDYNYSMAWGGGGGGGMEALETEKE